MKTRLVTLLALSSPSTFAQTPVPMPAPDWTSYLNIPIAYEFKAPKPSSSPQLGVLVRMRVGQIPRLGADVDGLAGVVAPTKTFASLAGQTGAGLSWSATWPGTSYYGRIGVGVLMQTDAQPFGTVYFLVGKH